MVETLLEIFLPAIVGGRAGCRVRIKPSWSGRVYGTYSLSGRHFLLALVFASSTTALAARLAALNLEQPSIDLEISTEHRSAGHQVANASIRYPARTVALKERAEELRTQSHRIERILGIPTALDAHAGMGRMDEDGASQHTLLERLAEETARLEEAFGRLDHELDLRAADLRYTPSIVPIADSQFLPTSPFGRRVSPFTRLPEVHRGLDLAADMHSKIVATADGTVVQVERNPRAAMGIYVVVDHGQRYLTYYGHCARVFVEVGDTVRRHQLIAEVGSTGRSTGPHVHYEVRRAGKPVDPRDFMMLDPRFQSESRYRFD